MSIFICDYCKKEYYRNSTQKHQEKHFCSTKCYHLASRKQDEIHLEYNYAYILLKKDNIEKKVLFDIEDIKKVQQYKWHLHLRKKDMRYDVCSNQYGTRKYLILSRYLMNCPDNMTIDHINQDTMDNRKENLRICTTFINNLNKSNNTSGCVGVCWDKSRNKWHVMFKTKNLGRFNNFEDAVKIRKQAEKEYLNQKS